jgi:hypothetical protein
VFGGINPALAQGRFAVTGAAWYDRNVNSRAPVIVIESGKHKHNRHRQHKAGGQKTETIGSDKRAQEVFHGIHPGKLPA